MKILANILFFLTLICCFSCQAPKQVTISPSSDIRNFRWNKADTASSASTAGDISWKAFFADSNLVRLIDTALIANSDYQQAMRQIEIARITYQTNKMALLPSLELQAGFNTQKASANTSSVSYPNASRVYNDLQLSLTSSWELDIWGKLNSQKKASKARFLSTQAGSTFVRTQLIAAIAGAYYELMAYDEQLFLIEKNLRLQATALDIVNVQKEAGKATALAVQQFEAQLHNTRAQKCHVSRMIVNAETYLNTLVGRFPQPIIRSHFITKQNIGLNLKVGVPVQLLERRPDIFQALGLLAAAGFDVQSARRAFYPSLTIAPTIGFAASDAHLLFDKTSLLWNVAGGLVAPLFQKNQIKGNYKLKLEEQRIALLAYEKVLKQSVAEVQNAMTTQEILNEEVNNKTNEVLALDNAVKTSHNLYAFGYATYLEVINAQKTVRDAELELVDIHKERMLNAIDLYRALGGGRF
ncbi:MAG: TolC family protein [Bacteroidota bacterium]|nr:TolC family protein [Bacteroidota bacterium]